MQGSRRVARVVSVIAPSCLALVAASLILSNHAAALGPLLVYGYVTDDAGRPIQQAHVIVTTYDEGVVVWTLSNTTNEDGFYLVTFGGMEGQWDVGFTVIAVAQLDGGGQADSAEVTIVDVGPMLQVDVQFPYEIPQFGSSILGFVAAAGIVGVLAVYLLPKKLKAGQN